MNTLAPSKRPAKGTPPLRQCDEAKASGERKVLKAAKAGEGELAGNHSANDDAFRPTPGTPWFTAIRSDDVIELILANPKAFILAFMIAFRARWKDGFNRHGLDKGEAMLGDWTAYGMTRQEYRTALITAAVTGKIDVRPLKR